MNGLLSGIVLFDPMRGVGVVHDASAIPSEAAFACTGRLFGTFAVCLRYPDDFDGYLFDDIVIGNASRSLRIRFGGSKPQAYVISIHIILYSC